MAERAAPCVVIGGSIDGRPHRTPRLQTRSCALSNSVFYTTGEVSTDRELMNVQYTFILVAYIVLLPYAPVFGTKGICYQRSQFSQCNVFCEIGVSIRILLCYNILSYLPQPDNKPLVYFWA